MRPASGNTSKPCRQRSNDGQFSVNGHPVNQVGHLAQPAANVLLDAAIAQHQPHLETPPFGGLAHQPPERKGLTRVSGSSHQCTPPQFQADAFLLTCNCMSTPRQGPQHGRAMGEVLVRERVFGAKRRIACGREVPGKPPLVDVVGPSKRQPQGRTVDGFGDVCLHSRQPSRPRAWVQTEGTSSALRAPSPRILRGEGRWMHLAQLPFSNEVGEGCPEGRMRSLRCYKIEAHPASCTNSVASSKFTLTQLRYAALASSLRRTTCSCGPW